MAPTQAEWVEKEVPLDRGLTASWSGVNASVTASLKLQLFFDSDCKHSVGEPITGIAVSAANQHVDLPAQPGTYRFIVSAIDASGAEYPSTCAAGRKVPPSVLSPGNQHVCALRPDQNVYCWGDNTYGQLGNGTFVGSATPVRVVGIDTAVALTSGSNHTCALLKNQTVVCWGRNDRFQLGNDDVNSASKSPVGVLGLSAAVAITSQSDHTCALLTDSSVQCWGSNSLRQLDQPSSWRSIPVAIAGLNSVTKLAVGSDFSCALLKSGGVNCWGSYWGSSGPTAIKTSSGTPLADIVTIAAGRKHACAQTNTGTLYCWGDNSYGQIGAKVNTALSASLITLTDQVSSIGLGANHSCAVLKNGAVSCWGSGIASRLGSTTWTSDISPTPIPNVSQVASLVANGQNTFATTEEGFTYAWGAENSSGQLGLGTLNGAALFSTGVTSAALGIDHSCSIQNNKVRCMGENYYGQLGNNTTAPATAPSETLITLPGNPTAVSTHDRHSCAIVAGDLQCWGSNGSGQLGIGNTTSSLRPETVSMGSTPVSQVSLGADYSCAVVGGGVMCWGYGYNGVLGNGSISGTYSTPQQATGLTSGVTEVSASYGHTCALKNGTVYCWGQNICESLANYTSVCSAGALGLGSTQTSASTPVLVTLADGATTATGISTGRFHTCAVVGGGVQCWGSDYYGQSARGSTGSNYYTPGWIAGLGANSGVIQVVAGATHSCALLNSGTVKCWGSAIAGANGTTTIARSPITISGVKDVQSIYASSSNDNTCAITSGGQLNCWGPNISGHLPIISPLGIMTNY